MMRLKLGLGRTCPNKRQAFDPENLEAVIARVAIAQSLGDQENYFSAVELIRGLSIIIRSLGAKFTSQSTSSTFRRLF